LRADTRSVEVDRFEEQRGLEWNRLAVIEIHNQRLFQGWWRQDGEFLLTITTDPAPLCPLSLL
jgi:hypothetical protein